MMQRPIRGTPFSQFQNSGVQGSQRRPLTQQNPPQIPASTVNQAFGARRMGEQFGASGIGREGAPDLRSAQAPVQSVQSAQPRTTMGQAIRQRDQVYSLSSQRGPEGAIVSAPGTAQVGQTIVQVAPFRQRAEQTYAPPEETDPNVDGNPKGPDARPHEPQFRSSRSALTAQTPSEQPGTVDPNPPAQTQTQGQGLTAQTSQPSSDPAAGYDPLAGLNPDEAAILQEAAAANQLSMEEARALWDAGYRPEDYYDRSGDKEYDTSWYQYRGNAEDRGRELGFDADEGGRKMAQNLLAQRNRQRQDTEEGEAQDKFDRAIQDILDMDGPDVSRALDAARQARELAAGRQMRSFYSSSMDPRAMQAMGAAFNENVASVGAAQDAQIQLQSEMQKYASQIAALQAAASIAGNVAQTAKINNMSIGLQQRLAALAQQNALFERNLMTPSFGEILGGFATQVGGGALSAFAQAGANKVFGL